MAERDHVDPYLTVDVVATFAGPGGVTSTVRGFWDGGRDYKVRFTPTVEGRWSYRIGSTPGDAGLTASGAFTAIAPAAGSHGFLRRDVAFPTSFVFDDGTRLFMWGTTYYMLLSNVLTESSWKDAIASLPRLGMNKVRLSFYPRFVNPRQDIGPRLGALPASFPFVAHDHDRPDLRQWRALDDAIRFMAAHGVLADVILLPYNFEGSYGSAAQRERFLRAAVARYAAFPNVIWCVTNEWNYHKLPQEVFNQAGRLIRGEDPWSRLGSFLRALSIHQQTRPDWNFSGERWPSHAIVQVGVRNHGASTLVGDEWKARGGQVKVFRHGDEWGNHSIVRNWTGRHPVVNDEYGYIGEPEDETEPKRADDSATPLSREKHRHAMWGIAVGGGYGAAGDKTLRADGAPYFTARWHDTPEYGDIKQLASFFTTSGIEYWRMSPANALVKLGTRVYVLAEPGRQYVFYAAAGGAFEAELPAGNYGVARYDPRTGGRQDLPKAEGGRFLVRLPDEQDWAVVVKAR